MAELLDFIRPRLNETQRRDYVALWRGPPVCPHLGRRVWLLLRPLEPIEQWAWSAYHPRFAIAMISDETESGAHLVRSLVLRATDEPVPTEPPAIFKEIEAAQRVEFPPAQGAWHWPLPQGSGSVA